MATTKRKKTYQEVNITYSNRYDVQVKDSKTGSVIAEFTLPPLAPFQRNMIGAKQEILDVLVSMKIGFKSHTFKPILSSNIPT